ncbi:sensor histidine kinase [Hahella ganghwensis]|uniref:sensor histidine kinase n=1 Tax=Hahella ganghwensis TaxID=286420 RepID=UPI0003809985|nr:ATP-binding protein [Hahella ganghwensis]
MSVTRYRHNIILMLIVMGLAVVISILARDWAHRSAVADLDRDAGYELRRAVAGLQAILAEYDSLPHILAIDPRLQQALQDPTNPQIIDETNRYLESINQIGKSSDVYLMNSEGTTIAANNWRSVKSFVGNNFRYRPYFRDAMEGRPGRYFALGTTSDIRGFYFSFPVSDDDVIVGVVVVKISLSDVEQQWASPWGQNTFEVMVTDQFGVVFISTRAEWRFRYTRPISQNEQIILNVERRYSDTALQPIQYEEAENPTKLLATGAKFVTVGTDPNATKVYLEREADMPEAGWQVKLLMPLDRVKQEVSNVLLMSLSMFLVIVLLAMLLMERYRRERAMRHAQEQLEARVEHRTKDLSEANIRLQNEVAERKRTESALKQTQEELVQAAKLALLGQLSASINHELNQPLTALRSYAQNAQAFIDRQLHDKAQMNLQEIVQLIDHMASIIGQLKVFSRKEAESVGAIHVGACISAALKITESEIRRHQIDLVMNTEDQDVFVLADMVRLEQVLINLITNGVQAIAEASADNSERRLNVDVTEHRDHVRIQVQDSGPGISEEALSHLFEPFFTTKTQSQGLGLGLSISHRIAESMGGSLTARNAVGGGAVFIISLRKAEVQNEPEMPAESASGLSIDK